MMVHFVPPSQRRAAVLAAQSDSALLIVGGSGSGKGAIATWVRQSGPRAGMPVLTAAHGESLANKLREAHEGTLLIHEISEWPLAEQRLLLHYLRSRSVPHADPSNPSPVLVNTRVIALTSHNLESRVQGGLFNRELLEAFESRIEMPDLAERQDEFRDIVLGLLSELTHDLRKDHLRSLSDEAWDRLTSYDWPGNLRELANVLERATILSGGKRELGAEAFDLPQRPMLTALPGRGTAPSPAARTAPGAPVPTLEDVQREHILHVLARTQGRIYGAGGAAQLLGLKPSTLQSRMKKLGIARRAVFEADGGGARAEQET